MLLLAACAPKEVRDPVADAEMHHIDSLLYGKPEQALTLLSRIDTSAMTVQQKAELTVRKARAQFFRDGRVKLTPELHRASDYFLEKTDTFSVLAPMIYGTALCNANRFEEGFLPLHKAIYKAIDIKQLRLQGVAAQHMALAYRDLGMWQSELDWAYSARIWLLRSGDTIEAYRTEPLLGHALMKNYRYQEVAELAQNADRMLLRTDTTYRIQTMMNHADALYEQQRFEASRAVMDSMLADSAKLNAYYWLSRAMLFFNLHDNDEMSHCIDKAWPLCASLADSTLAYHATTALYGSQGDFQRGFPMAVFWGAYQILLQERTSGAMPAKIISDYYKMEEREARDHARNATVASVLLGVLLLIIIIMSVVARNRYRRRLRQRHEELKELMKTLEALDSTAVASDTNTELLELRFATANRLCALLFAHTKGNAEAFDKKVESTTSHFKSDEFFDEAEKNIDRYYDGLMSSLRADLPDLQANLFRLAILLRLGFSTEAIAFIIGSGKVANVYPLKSRLKKYITECDSPRRDRYLADFGFADK